MENGLGLEETLTGAVERVAFHAPDTGFAVLRVRPVGRRETITVVGRILAVSAGETIEATGLWANDPTHGQQFKARIITSAAPEGAAGIEAFLGSGAFPGIGRATARKLVLAFGEEVFDVIEHSPARLSRVSGITAAKAKAVAEAWGEQKAARETMVFLQGHGIGPAQAASVFKAWGAQAPARIQADPYALAREVRELASPPPTLWRRSSGRRPIRLRGSARASGACWRTPCSTAIAPSPAPKPPSARPICSAWTR